MKGGPWCGCALKCGDLPEEQDNPRATCKGLPLLPPKPPVEIVLWPRGRCEHWLTARTMCGKAGRWMVGGQIRCGEHRDSR